MKNAKHYQIDFRMDEYGATTTFPFYELSYSEICAIKMYIDYVYKVRKMEMINTPIMARLEKEFGE